MPYLQDAFSRLSVVNPRLDATLVGGRSLPPLAKPSQRGRQELHVQRHQKEQVCPEEEPIKAVTVGIAEKIEEDDVG